jgi:hypothetical protein
VKAWIPKKIAKKVGYFIIMGMIKVIGIIIIIERTICKNNHKWIIFIRRKDYILNLMRNLWDLLLRRSDIFLLKNFYFFIQLHQFEVMGLCN